MLDIVQANVPTLVELFYLKATFPATGNNSSFRWIRLLRNVLGRFLCCGTMSTYVPLYVTLASARDYVRVVLKKPKVPMCSAGL